MENDVKNIEDTELFQYLKPLMIWMHLYGAFFLNPRQSGGTSSSRFLRWLPILGRYYSTFVCISLTIGFICFTALLPIIVDFSSLSCLSSMLLTVVFSVGVWGHWMFYKFNISGQMCRLFNLFSEIGFAESDVKKIRPTIIKFQWSVMIWEFMVMWAAKGGFYLIMFSDQVDENMFIVKYLVRIIPPPFDVFGFHLINLGTFVIVTTLCIISGFILIMCFVCCCLFNLFDKSMKSTLVEIKENNTSDRLSRSRLNVDSLLTKYVKINQFLNGFNNCIDIFIFVSFSSFILFFAGVLFFLKFACISELMFMIYSIWFGCIIIYVVPLMLFSAEINTSAIHCGRTLHRCYAVQVRQYESYPKIYQLVNYSNRSDIGLSALGFFVITRDFNLNLISTILSYISVLFQFAPSDQSCHYLQNSTNF